MENKKIKQTTNQIKYLDCKQKWQPLEYHDGAPPPGRPSPRFASAKRSSPPVPASR